MPFSVFVIFHAIVDMPVWTCGKWADPISQDQTYMQIKSQAACFSTLSVMITYNVGVILAIEH